MSILVLGSINTDLVVRGPRLPMPGETVVGGEFFQAAGGKGANQAVAAARLGAGPVVLVGAVGDDAFGRRALGDLARENIDCTHIKAVPGRASGVALILVDERGENCISVAGGANLAVTPAGVNALPAAVLARSRVFLTGFESPLPAVLRGLERARSAGLTTLVNPAPARAAAACREILALTDVLTPNEHEAASLTGLSVTSRESAVAAARRLRELGPACVIVTLGSAGAVVVEEEVTFIAAVLAGPVVDTTAAGDCFSGALAVALAEGQAVVDAARFAARAAGISVTRRGAQPSLPFRREVDQG